ncbi:MAG: hypothetical protein ACREMZ_12425 [Gemmatimonadales bacterium]
MGASAAIHLLLMALAVGLSARQPAAPDPIPEDVRSEVPRVNMIYLRPPAPPPPMPPRPPPAPDPVAPPIPRSSLPPVERSRPEPEPNAPPETTRSSAAEREGGRDYSEPERSAEAPTAESEARRIFGRPRLAKRPGVGPESVRPMEAWVTEPTERCVPRPAPPGESAGPSQVGTVTGRIFRQDNGEPLAGAHLHMIGTPHVAFTDGRGEYRFSFDMALVDNCRTQYVRVTAEGYESRLLVVMVGPRESEDVLLRRR